ncbi:MAG: AAA family ATPase [Methanosarcinaceae archaeon]|nr:AAA family ATPase [Methanosarcinaceae archaeon]
MGMNQEEINRQYEELKNKGQLEFITFHPSYSYEEFVEGITIDVDPSGKPTEQLNYKLKQGIFKQMVIRALIAVVEEGETTDSLGQLLQKYREKIRSFDNEYDTQKERVEAIKDWWADKPRFVLIIDEINRGDISKIFGELITLLEADKRLGMENEVTVTLPYSQEEFCIPPNLYVIGTMNTADKSIALIDVALRRRFGFIEMSPDLEVLRKEHINKNKKELEEEGVLDGLELSVESLKNINERIAADPTVGRDKQIGHSFLFKVQTQNDLILVWKNEILPLLEEYYYGQYSKINELLFNSASDSPWLNKTSGISDFETYEDLINFLDKVYKVN